MFAYIVCIVKRVFWQLERVFIRKMNGVDRTLNSSFVLELFKFMHSLFSVRYVILRDFVIEGLDKSPT